MISLHKDCLTRRYLPDRLNFLEGPLGFGLGILCVLEGLRTLGPLRLRVTLQGLVFLDEILELLLNLANSGLLLLALDGLLGCFVFGLEHRLLWAATSVVAPVKIMKILGSKTIFSLSIYRRGITYLCSLQAAS